MIAPKGNTSGTNESILESGVYDGMKVIVKGLAGTGEVKAVDFKEKKVLVEIWVYENLLMESD